MIKRIYIYCIYFPISKKYYIGQTQNLKVRLYYHLKNPLLVGNALRKYNDWQIEILHTTKDRDEANRIEIEEIRHYNCVAPNGYNLSRGGESGHNGCYHTEKTKEKMKMRKHSEEAKRKMRGLRPLFHPNQQRKSNSFYGKKHSKESIEKMRKNAAMKNSKSKLKWKISRLKTSIKKLENNL